MRGPWARVQIFPLLTYLELKMARAVIGPPLIIPMLPSMLPSMLSICSSSIALTIERIDGLAR